MRPILPLAVALGILASLASGCGSGESEVAKTTPSKAPPLSDAPIVAALNSGKANATWRVPIQGMHCDGCASGIESELKRMTGVAAAAVGYTEGLALVAVDTNQVTFAALSKVVADAGYQASAPQP